MSEIINNREHRIRALADIIKSLHAGASPDSVRSQLKEIVRETNSSEIAAMEQELMREGLSVDEVRSMCNLHAEVLQEISREPQMQGFETPGHPVQTFKKENAAIKKVCGDIRAAVAEFAAGAEGGSLDRVRDCLNQLMDVDKHYLRKEHLLFPKLERYGVSGPSKVMWAKDDEARTLLKGAQQSAGDWNGEDKESLAASVLRAVDELEGMVLKEENILLPLSSTTLTEEDWGRIWEESSQYGWCLVEPDQGYSPPARAEAETVSAGQKQTIRFEAGALLPHEVRGIFGALPLDLTFVGPDDRVHWFSEGKDRIFVRSKAVIGRKVQHCHPPASVHVVEHILADFKSGKQDQAEFWIEYRGRFVHIRYFAVRGDQGEYLGTLELTQDLTPLRGLQGERRLLQYD